MQRPLFQPEQGPLLHLSEKNRRTSGGLALGALHALYGQCLGGLHQQHAHAVEGQRAEDVGVAKNSGRLAAKVSASMQATVR